MKKLKFAVIGCGRIAPSHLEGIKTAPHAELVAVCDIVEDKSKKAAEEYGLSKWYTDAETMLKSEDIDVCCVCTPSGLHREIACLAANYGKHILCEKPLEVTSEKMQEMIDTCRKNNVKLGAIFQRRTFDGAIKVKEIVESGALGKVTMADVSMKYYRDQEYYDSDTWRGTWEYDGGGALMNQGIHGVDMLSWIMGGIHSVYARCDRLRWDIETEDTAVVCVKYKSGALGVIQGTTTAYPGLDTVFSFHGSEGSISFGDSKVYTWQLKDENMKEPEITGSMGGLNCQYSTTNFGHDTQIEDMALAVLNDCEPMVTGEEAKKSVELILAIYESAKTGKEIVLD